MQHERFFSVIGMTLFGLGLVLMFLHLPTSSLRVTGGLLVAGGIASAVVFILINRNKKLAY